MNKVKKLVILLTIILLTIIILLIGTSVKKRSGGDGNAPTIEEGEIPIKESFVKLDNLSDYFNIKYCLDLYYINLDMLADKDLYINYYGYTEEAFNNQLSDSFNKVYAMLDKKYIDMYNITEKNIADRYKDYEEGSFYIDDIYVIDISQNVSFYVVYGKTIKYSTGDVVDDGFIVKLDEGNLTYSICPYEFLKDNDYLDIREGDIISLNKQETIEKNDYNTYKYQLVDDAQVAREIMENYVVKLAYEPEEAYELLEDDYKTSRFESLDDFKNYLGDLTIDEILQIQLDKFQVKQYNDYRQFICVDLKGNYYLFNDYGIMDYKVILDTYTLDLPEFLEKYNSTNEQGKVALNIDKFIKSINNKDYRYAYNHLSNGFREKNFNNLTDFKNYIDKNFFDNNIVNYQTFEQRSDNLYVFNVSISAEESEEELKKAFIVKLRRRYRF